jgi:hypothetical protein
VRELERRHSGDFDVGSLAGAVLVRAFQLAGFFFNARSSAWQR